MYAFTAHGAGANKTPFLIGLNATDGSPLTSMYKAPAGCFDVLSMVIKNGKNIFKSELNCGKHHSIWYNW